VLGFSNHGCLQSSSLDQLYSVCWYRKQVVSLIGAYKYGHSVRAVASVFRDLIERATSEDLVFAWDHAVFVPIPLHPKKRSVRGFNQSEDIAHMLADIFDGCVDTSLVSRTKNTVSQTTLSHKNRKGNVIGAFSVHTHAGIDSERPYVLVDDVVTTGSTLEACAKAIKSETSITTINAFTFARG